MNESDPKLVLLEWAIIIAAAWLAGRVARRLGQPRVVGEIAVGILLGPSALGLIWPQALTALFPAATQPSLHLLGKVGLILLMLQVGMEFDFGHLRSRSRSVVAISLSGIALPLLCALIVGPWLHRHFAASHPYLGFQFFLCIGFSITALPVLARIMLEAGIEKTPLGALCISAAAIDDGVGWLLLAAASALVSSTFNGIAVVGQVAGLLAFAWFVTRGLGPWLGRVWRRTSGRADAPAIPSSFLALLLIALLGCCLVTSLLGVFSIFGAFLLGASLHRETGLLEAWHKGISGFVMIALVPIFFTNSGLRTEIGSLSSPLAWLACGLVVFLACFGKLGGCYVAARTAGEPSRRSACIAVLMNTRGLMELVAINIGLELGLLSPQVFTMLVLMALSTTLMTAPLLRRALSQEESGKVLERELSTAGG
jgi:Kef-type K+ transport system membrane component KefB